MSKAILVMDMPNCCDRCKLCKIDATPYEIYGFCLITNSVMQNEELNTKPDDCPLKVFPEKRRKGTAKQKAISNDCYDGFATEDAYFEGKDDGYNECLDELLSM